MMAFRLATMAGKPTPDQSGVSRPKGSGSSALCTIWLG